MTTDVDLTAIAARMKYTLVTECPVCDQKDYEIVLVGRYDCVLCRCPHCGVVFLNPRPRKPESSDGSGYSPAHAATKYLPRMVKLGFLSPDHVPDLKKLYWRYLKLVQMTCQLEPTDPVVDIGCGIGLSMLALRYKGIKSIGIDINDEFIGVARNTFGLEVHKHDVQTKKMQPPAKVATLNAVLEHIERPVEFLQNIRENILAPDGRLIVTIPNLASLQFLRDGGQWEVISGGHVWYPTEETASMVARRAGFVVERFYREPDKPTADHLHFFVRRVLGSQANLTGGIGMILRAGTQRAAS